MLDQVLTDLKSRFSQHQRQSFMLMKLLPKNVVGSSWDVVKPVVVKYAGLLLRSEVVLKNEFLLWQQRCMSKRASVHQPANALEALSQCLSLTFPNIHKLLKVLATLPVSTATPERVFSKVERTLTAIRSTMSEERLQDLILLQAKYFA